MRVLKQFLCAIIMIFSANLLIADTITLNWLNENGTVSSTTTCESGGDVILPQNTPAAPTGYHFAGWRANYKPVEYLESTGTQWIDTSFIPNQDTRVITILKPITNGWLFGVRGGAITDSFCLSNTIDDYNSSRHNINISNKVLFVEKNKNITKIKDMDDNIIQTSSFTYTSFSPYKSLYVFGLNNAGETDSYASRVYYFKMYDDDILVRDFIPVLDYNGVPCMYDKVSGTFFYNQGTGDFIAGPIVNE